MGGVEVIIIISAVAAILLLAELLLPTGGVLAIIGAAGLVVAGVVAFGEDTELSDYAGAGLITFGVLSLATFLIITPKVYRSQVDVAPQTGREDLAGQFAEVREPLNPQGQVWVGGALWKARVADDARPQGIGNRVRIDSVDGLTLVVSDAENS
jgi:membrane-bound serine protease (ClpP class)